MQDVEGGAGRFSLAPQPGRFSTALGLASAATGQPRALGVSLAAALRNQVVAHRPGPVRDLARLPTRRREHVECLLLRALAPLLGFPGCGKRGFDPALPLDHRFANVREDELRHDDEDDGEGDHLDDQSRIRNQEVAGLEHGSIPSVGALPGKTLVK